MAWAYVVSTHKGLGTNGGTSDAIDTTGSDFLAVVVSEFGNGTHGTLSDSKGNTWTELTSFGDGTAAQVTIYYVQNPTVGSGHTFSYSGTNVFATLATAGFSGSAASPFDQENGATGSATNSIATGSVTPGQDNELVIAAVSIDGTQGSDLAINGGFTLAEFLNYNGASGFAGCGLAYLIQTTATAANPTWSWTNNVTAAASIATFKSAAAGGGAGSFVLVSGRLGFVFAGR